MDDLLTARVSVDVLGCLGPFHHVRSSDRSNNSSRARWRLIGLEAVVKGVRESSCSKVMIALVAPSNLFPPAVQSE